MDKPPTKDGNKFWSIFSDNLQPIATRRKKARSTLLVDKYCGNGCSIKRTPLSVSYYNKISSGHIWGGCTEEVFCRPSTAPVVGTLFVVLLLLLLMMIILTMMMMMMALSTQNGSISLQSRKHS